MPWLWRGSGTDLPFHVKQRWPRPERRMRSRGWMHAAGCGTPRADGTSLQPREPLAERWSVIGAARADSGGVGSAGVLPPALPSGRPAASPGARHPGCTSAGTRARRRGRRGTVPEHGVRMRPTMDTREGSGQGIASVGVWAGESPTALRCDRRQARFFTSSGAPREGSAIRVVSRGITGAAVRGSAAACGTRGTLPFPSPGREQRALPISG